MLTGCSSSAQKQTASAENSVAGQQVATSQWSLGQLEKSIPNALNFFQSLLSGNPSAIMSAEAPAVTSLTQQYEQNRVQENEFAPRGGGRTAADVTAPSTEAGQLETLVEQGQTTGAEGVTSIDQLLASLSEGSLSGASATLGNLAQSQNDQQQNSEAVASSTGEGLGALAALLIA